MNLQQILSHRNTCFICQSKLIYFNNSYPKLVYTTDAKGFHIHSRHKQGIAMHFNFDGSFSFGEREYKIYREATISIIKQCPNCREPGNAFPGYHTTLSNIKKKEYAYHISLIPKGNTHRSVLGWEAARYHDDQQFFHVDTYHPSYHSELRHATFDKKIEDIFTVSLTSPINLSNINTIDEFTNKCRTVINFS
jgi:hypothetical protein